jgi:hypothetical protein
VAPGPCAGASGERDPGDLRGRGDRLGLAGRRRHRGGADGRAGARAGRGRAGVDPVCGAGSRPHLAAAGRLPARGGAGRQRRGAAGRAALDRASARPRVADAALRAADRRHGLRHPLDLGAGGAAAAGLRAAGARAGRPACRPGARAAVPDRHPAVGRRLAHRRRRPPAGGGHLAPPAAAGARLHRLDRGGRPLLAAGCSTGMRTHPAHVPAGRRTPTRSPPAAALPLGRIAGAATCGAAGWRHGRRAGQHRLARRGSGAHRAGRGTGRHDTALQRRRPEDRAEEGRVEPAAVPGGHAGHRPGPAGQRRGRRPGRACHAPAAGRHAGRAGGSGSGAPMADGGEGFTEALVDATGGTPASGDGGRPAGQAGGRVLRLSRRPRRAHGGDRSGRGRRPAPGAARSPRSDPHHKLRRGRADPRRARCRRPAHPAGLRRLRHQRRRRRHGAGIGRAPARQPRAADRLRRRRTGAPVADRSRRARPAPAARHPRCRRQLAQRAARAARRGACVRSAEGGDAAAGRSARGRPGELRRQHPATPPAATSAWRPAAAPRAGWVRPSLPCSAGGCIRASTS